MRILESRTFITLFTIGLIALVALLAPPVAGAQQVRAARVDSLPGPDPAAAAWETAPELVVPVLAQNMAMPILEKATIDAVRVRSLTDGISIAWRVTWKDDQADWNVDAARFCDAVAVQFPVDPGASFTMGHPMGKVQILHWKALWQKDVDEHFQDVQDLHPNYWADLYWFAEPRPGAEPGTPRYRVPDSFEDPRSHEWFPAYRAGNPMAEFHRTIPVEELVAEGFGTLTSQNESVTAARGVWKDGEWSVVFRRPLRTDDVLDAQFTGGQSAQIGFAVWDGGAGNVGARKHYSYWVPFEVEP